MPGIARVGVIGAGVMGTIHVQLLGSQVNGAVVAAVGDVDEARARALAARDGAGATAYGDPLEVVRDGEVEAVVVASSDASHEALVLACLEAGKPVLCEKPLAVTAEEGLRVVEAEAALGRRLVSVGYMRRFDRGYAALKATLDGGALGAPLLVHCVHRNAAVPAEYTSDMLVMNTGVHEIDVIRWLLGEEIAAISVLAPRSSSLAGGRRDPQVMLLETESGVLVDVEVFVNAQYGYDIRCEVVGEVGTAALAPPREIDVRQAALEGFAVPDGFGARFEDAYRRELQAWVAGLRGGARGRRERVGRLRGQRGGRDGARVAAGGRAARGPARAAAGALRARGGRRRRHGVGAARWRSARRLCAGPEARGRRRRDRSWHTTSRFGDRAGSELMPVCSWGRGPHSTSTALPRSALEEDPRPQHCRSNSAGKGSRSHSEAQPWFAAQNASRMRVSCRGGR